MKKYSIILSAAVLIGSLSSCAVVGVPLNVAGKAITTTAGIAGNVVSAGVDAVIPDGEPSE